MNTSQKEIDRACYYVELDTLKDEAEANWALMQREIREAKKWRRIFCGFLWLVAFATICAALVNW